MTWITVLPVLLQLLGWLLKWYGASEETILRYKSLIASTANDGLISVATKDRVMGQRGKILDRLKKQQNEDKAP